MREILFRGKRMIKGEWAIGYYSKSKYYEDGPAIGDCIVVPHPEDVNKHIDCFSVYPETVGQYTGLRDCNGKRIFEGDIIKYAENIDEYLIVFECGGFALCDKCGEMIQKIGGINDYCYPLMTLYEECCWDECIAYDLEVIGNKWDNPELLKECE